ncbi:MAG: hypothetical protein HUU29_12975, partial [Planctomycetaceae bacterium]|nr:hypothetical protein [Planctomycetaceae bacterium]
MTDVEEALDSSTITPDIEPKIGFVRWKAILLLPLPIALFAGLYVIFGDTLAQSAMDAALSASLGEHTRIKDYQVSFSVFGPKLTVENLECFHPDKKLSKGKTAEEVKALPDEDWNPIFAFKRLNADVDFLALLAGRVWINDFEFSGLRVYPRNFSKVKEPDEPEEQKTPTTPIESVTELLQQVEDIRNNEWIRQAMELVEGDEEQESEEERLARELRESVPPSPTYIMDELSKLGQPAFLSKKGSINDLELNFHRKHFKPTGNERSMHSLTQTSLTVENVSSSPKEWGRFITATGFGLVNGKEGERIDLSFAINYSDAPEDALKPTYGSIASDTLKFAKLFGESLTKVKAGFYSYTADHPTAKGASVVRLGGQLANLGSRAELSLWLDGDGKQGTKAALGLKVDDLPVDKVLGQLGDLPFDFEPGMKASLMSCNADGRTIGDAPDNPSTCLRLTGDQLEMHLMLNLTGVRLKPIKGKKILGIPSERFVPAFNEGIATLQDDKGRVPLQVGFSGGASNLSFGLERPGTRGLVLLVIGAMELGVADVAGRTDIGGIVFEDNMVLDLVAPPDVDTAERDRHDLKDIGCRAILKNAMLDPKKQPKKIAGMDSQYFVFAWNKFMGKSEGVPIADVTLFDSKENFSPSMKLDTNSLTKDMGKSLGIEDFAKEPAKALEKTFGKEFDDFKKDPGKAFKDLTGKDIPVPLP